MLFRSHDFLEAALLDERQVHREALLAAQPVFRATRRPVENHTQYGLRVGHAKREHRGTAQAASHDVGPPDPEVLRALAPKMTAMLADFHHALAATVHGSSPTD